MAALTAVQALPLQLEAFSPYIAETVEADGELARLLGNGNGGATRVSLRSFRARLKTALASTAAQLNLDTGTLPPGIGNKYDQMLLTPVAWTIPIQYSQLAQLVGEGENVATDSAVTDTISDVARQAINFRDILLQTPGDGSIGSIDSTTGANFINLRSSLTNVLDGRGAHLAKEQQFVQVMSPGYVLRGTCQIQNVFKGLGATQQIQVDQIPLGTVAGDLVMFAGVAPGAPQFVNGIPVFVSTSALGNLYGISRGLPYVVANGVPLANNAQVSKPVFRISQNQIIQRLGISKLKNQFWHTNPSQLQGFEELAFGDSYVPLEGGKGGSYDPLFADFTINGRKVYINPHADQTRWDLLLKEAWNTIKWGPGMFWFKLRSGQMVFSIVDPTTGTPTTQEAMYYVVAEQWFFYVLDSEALMDHLKPTLIDSNGENPNEAEGASHRERLSERAPVKGDAIVCSHGNMNHETMAEMTIGAPEGVTNKKASTILSFKAASPEQKSRPETDLVFHQLAA